MKLPALPKFVQARKVPLLIVGGVLAAGAIAVPIANQVGLFKGKDATSKVLDELTVAAKREKLTMKIKSSGSITPRQTVNVSPKSSGKVVEMLVEQGDTVTEGQVIARMDASDLEQDRQREEANVLAAEARLAQFRNPTRPEAVNQARNEVMRSQGDVFNAESDISSAQSEITRTEGLIGDATSQMTLATRQYERNQKLRAEGGLSENALDEFLRKKQGAEQALRQTIAQRNQAQEKLKQAYAKREQARIQVASREEALSQQGQSGSSGDIAIGEAQLNSAVAQLNSVKQKIADTEVRAPFAGLVTQRYASVGAFVTPTTQASSTTGGGATSTSLVAIASDVEVLAKIPEVDIGQVKPGLTGEMVVDAFPGETFKAKVRLIAPEAIEERDVRFFQVRLKLISGQRKLKSGMNADIEFSGPESEALLVPNVAIVTKKGKPGVLVPDGDGKPKFQPVTVGTSQSGRSRRGKGEGGEGSGGGKSGGKTQITEGLKEGDRVFIKLPDGKKLDELLKDEKEKEKK
jgi:HlyD family secretion protein